MMTINAHTKISSILEQHPDALETIVAISPRFVKLRNPVLRKLMAGRATIAMASRAGGCTVKDFYDRLSKLGFVVGEDEPGGPADGEVVPPADLSSGVDEWDKELERFAGKQVTIDVRELEMPLPMMTILGALDSLPAGEALFVHHKRIPVFLLPELAERGFAYRIHEAGDGTVQLLIYKTNREEYYT